MQLYILNGSLKGRIVNSFFYIDLRPTKSFVRKVLFNWINPFIKSSNICDFFSGSGILSFESISMGANSVFVFEKKNIYVENILKNSILFCIDKLVYALNLDSLAFIKNIKYLTINIVFLDPPYINDSFLILFFFFLIE